MPRARVGSGSVFACGTRSCSARICARTWASSGRDSMASLTSARSTGSSTSAGPDGSDTVSPAAILGAAKTSRSGASQLPMVENPVRLLRVLLGILVELLLAASAAKVHMLAIVLRVHRVLGDGEFLPSDRAGCLGAFLLRRREHLGGGGGRGGLGRGLGLYRGRGRDDESCERQCGENGLHGVCSLCGVPVCRATIPRHCKARASLTDTVGRPISVPFRASPTRRRPGCRIVSTEALRTI